MSDRISRVHAREILSGIGRPTVEVTLATEGGVRATASAPSGTSRGRHEAREVHDGGERYGGLGCRRAVANVNELIAPALLGHDPGDQEGIDRLLIDLDGTADKSRLGANAILPVSMAAARAAAATAGVPLHERLGGPDACRLPAPLATVIAGGPHSPSPLTFEDYVLVLAGFSSFAEALAALAAARAALGELLVERFGPVPDVGGALAPPIADTRQAFDLMLAAVDRAGAAGRVSLGIDAAGSGLFDERAGTYAVEGRRMSVDELAGHFRELAGEYPLTVIEDPFGEDDFEAFARLTAALPGRLIVGDDLFASNAERIAEGAARAAGNTLLLKVNQAGTVSEACRAGRLALDAGLALAVSIRSSDTNDSFIADLAVALGAAFIKLGSPVRGERNAKYNRLLAIEEALGPRARFAGGGPGA